MKGIMVRFAALAIFSAGCIVARNASAGETLKWEQIPKAVQDTVLAHGGVAGQAVDKEAPAESVGGKVTYEAQVKDKDGKVADLVITEDGKLAETKKDNAADAAAEQAEAAARAERAKKILAGVKFSHPREITHPFLPLSKLKQDIIDGSEDGKKTHIERTLMPQKHRTFTVGDQEVDTLIMEDRAFVDGKLEEVALDYFAQDDAGNVYYFGEDVDEYDTATGKLLNHEGAWLLGKDTPVPGIVLPAHPKVGDKFSLEDVSKEISEDDVVLSLSETVTVPAGTFKNCIKIKEHLQDGTDEYKYYAKGVGAVREVPATGDELLISHNGKPAKPGAVKPAAPVKKKGGPSASVKNPSAAQVAEWVKAYKAAHPGRGGKDWDINAKSAAQIAADPDLKRLLDLCGPDARPVIPSLAWEYGGADHQWKKPEASALAYGVYIPVSPNSEHWKYDKAAGKVSADVYVLFPEQNPGKDKVGAAQVMSCLGDPSNIEILVDSASLRDGKDVGLDLSEAATDLYLLQPDGSRVLMYQGK